MKIVELHQHLELSVRHSTIRELASQVGVTLTTDADFKDRFLITQPMKDLASVLNKFLDTQLFWNSEEVIERLTFEVCEDSFRNGVRVLELRYAPTFIRYRHDDLTFEGIHEAIVRGAQRAEKNFGMAVGLICIIQRILPVKEAEAVTDFAIANKDTFVGLDLADNEEGFDSKPFAPFFLRARKAGLGITIHAGEVNTAKSPRYPKDAVEHLGATRIGHGIQIHRDPEMIEYALKNNIVLETCLTSNYLTQAVPGTVADHPIRKLFDAGVRVTINTDDPGIFNTDMTKEYSLARRHFKFSEEELATMNQYALEASFIPKAKKEKAFGSQS
jgi:adenosine deaminase